MIIELLNKWADFIRKWIKKKNKPVMQDQGLRELVNFGEWIGYDVHPGTFEKTPTTWGIIHYGKKGAHIIPARPPIEKEEKQMIDEKYLQLATLRALDGEIIPNLRAVVTDLDLQNEHVFVSYYFDGEIDDEDFEMAACVSSEIIASFPVGYCLNDHIHRLDSPETIPCLGFFAYLRQEKESHESLL